jgi:hypothetical protein
MSGGVCLDATARSRKARASRPVCFCAGGARKRATLPRLFSTGPKRLVKTQPAFKRSMMIYVPFSAGIPASAQIARTDSPPYTPPTIRCSQPDDSTIEPREAPVVDNPLRVTATLSSPRKSDSDPLDSGHRGARRRGSRAYSRSSALCCKVERIPRPRFAPQIPNSKACRSPH